MLTSGQCLIVYLKKLIIMQTISLRQLRLMLVFLLTGFILSQAYRTLGGVLSVPLRAEFQLDNETLSSIVGSFHIAFGSLQLLIGICVDCFGIRKTILSFAPFTVIGAVLSAMAMSPEMLLLGQVLLGLGCAPAFLVCIVLISRNFPAQKFAGMYGVALGLGSIGLIFTSTPLAMISEQFGWRSSFYILAVCSCLSWLLIYFTVKGIDDSVDSSLNTKQKLLNAWHAISGYKDLLKMKQTWGILSLLFVCYAAFLTLRGLWLGPLLVERFGQSLVFVGNLALALSIISLFSPSIFGRFDPGAGRRYPFLYFMPWIMVVGFIVLALSPSLWVCVACTIVIAIVNSCSVWQVADIRDIYPKEMQGRALALGNSAFFLGISFMQAISGKAHTLLPINGLDVFASVFLMCALVLSVGIIGYITLRR